MQGVNDKLLIQPFKDLEADRVLARNDYKEVPPRVDYALTPLPGRRDHRAHQKVRRSHPRFECAEGMLNRLPTDAHLVRVLIQTLLHRVDHALMFPTFDAPRRRRGALCLSAPPLHAELQ